jgi:hypothetical protein
MGSSASASISLLLNSESNSFYWAGDALSGDVVVAVSRPLTIKSIDVSVTGQVSITKTDGDSPVTSTEKFYNEYYSILISPTNGISFDEVSRLRYPKVLMIKRLFLPNNLFTVLDSGTIFRKLSTVLDKKMNIVLSIFEEKSDFIVGFTSLYFF